MQIDEYRKLAETEDRMWYFRALHRRLEYWLRRKLPAERARVLDAGCGTGGFIRHLEAGGRDWELTGLDLSPVACELARQRTQVKIREGSLTTMPFWDDSYDGIVTGDVLYHIDDVPRVLGEFARCLKPGGVLVLNEPAYRWLWSYHDTAVESRHRFTRPELRQRLEAAGFEVGFSSYANFFVLPLVIARRKLFPPKQPTSDVGLAPPPVEAFLSLLAWIEFNWMRLGLPLPAGSSVFMVARKKV
jgi:SAM-dependent methyltransferase